MPQIFEASPRSQNLPKKKTLKKQCPSTRICRLSHATNFFLMKQIVSHSPSLSRPPPQNPTSPPPPPVSIHLFLHLSLDPTSLTCSFPLSPPPPLCLSPPSLPLSRVHSPTGSHKHYLFIVKKKFKNNLRTGSPKSEVMRQMKTEGRYPQK